VVAATGLRITELRRGFVSGRMPLQGNANHIGTLYAGALFMLADIAAGALFLASFDTDRYFAVVKGLNLDFLKPAKSDVLLSYTLSETELEAITAAAARGGKADFRLEGALYSEEAVVVAQCQGLFQVRNVSLRPKAQGQ
jgi:acyl-coenzyme A thioesterase PaaI-like protein